MEKDKGVNQPTRGLTRPEEASSKASKEKTESRRHIVQWRPLADLEKEYVDSLASDGTSPSHDRLRTQLVLLIGLCLTQEKYIAWLRTMQPLNAEYLAEEEAMLAHLRQRVHATALKRAQQAN